jgi:hypothetical protein
MKSFFWTAYCSKDRVLAISEIQNIINKYGYIVDFKKFSDISIAISIDIEEHNIDKLYGALKEFMNLNEFEKLNSVSKNECKLFINTTFLKGTGNLRIEVPSVPG